MNTGNNKISRREFNKRMAGLGVGLASAGLFPSFAKSLPGSYPPGKYLDVHHHLGKEVSADPAGFTFDPLLKWMDQFDVSQTVILSAIRHPNKYYTKYRNDILNTDSLLDKFAETEGRILPFADVHTEAVETEKELVKILKDFKQKGVIGFGELKPRKKNGDPGNLSLDDPAMKRIYAACAELDFPVLLHIDNRFAVDVPGLPALERVLKEFPEVNFIGHANGWWNSISGDVKEFKGYPKEKVTPGGAAGRMLQEYPNMYADLSAGSGLNAITRDPEVGMEFLIKHQDKLMFGTDAAGGTGRESHFEFYNNADLPPEVEAKLFRDNARKLLKI